MQQSLLDLVDGGLPLVSHFFKVRPDQERAGDVIALDARFAALALLDARQLLDFAVILPDLPTKGARLLRARSRILSRIVGHDPFRAMRRHHNPEKSHLATAYAYNLGLGYKNFAWNGHSIAELTQSASTVLVADSLGAGAGQEYTYDSGCPYASALSCAAGLAVYGTDNPAQRHLEGQNFGFADGHVKWFKGQSGTQSAKVYNFCTPSSAGGAVNAGCPAPAAGGPTSGSGPTYNVTP